MPAFTLHIVIAPTNPTLRPRAETLQQGLEAIGVEGVIHEVDFNAVVAILVPVLLGLPQPGPAGPPLDLEGGPCDPGDFCTGYDVVLIQLNPPPYGEGFDLYAASDSVFNQGYVNPDMDALIGELAALECPVEVGECVDFAENFPDPPVFDTEVEEEAGEVLEDLQELYAEEQPVMIEWLAESGAPVRVMFYNFNNDYLRQVEVRQALSLAYDRESIEVPIDGRRWFTQTPLHPLVPAWIPEVSTPVFDLEEARALIEDAVEDGDDQGEDDDD